MSRPGIDRRSLLGLLGAGAALPATFVPARASDASFAFAHGVASGDPTTHGAILWTRLTTDAAGAVPIGWHVAEHADGKPIESGTAEARPARDHTVKVEAKRLRPSHDYHYWFEAQGVRSPVGRFRTLPEGATADLVLAFANCQLYGNGLFNAYDAIAREPRVDAVVHLGDYIYEYEPRDYGGAMAAKLNRIAAPNHEIVTLDDYRVRHAAYKSDPDLQAAHARAAFICV